MYYIVYYNNIISFVHIEVGYQTPLEPETNNLQQYHGTFKHIKQIKLYPTSMPHHQLQQDAQRPDKTWAEAPVSGEESTPGNAR